MAAKRKDEPKTPNRTSLERTSDKELLIKRSFRAPPHLVFDAYTKPEYVKRWWAPRSRGVTMVQCDVDLRPGGAYRYVIGRGEDERYAFFGKYLEISRPTRVVYTQSFEPHPGEAVVTVSFEDRDGSTLFVAREVYPSKEALDMAISSGMEEGMFETFDLLDELVVSLAS